MSGQIFVGVDNGSATIRCPYNCFREYHKALLAQHFKEVHPTQILKNNCFFISRQWPFAHHQFVINEWRTDRFLSKYRAKNNQEIEFCTTCLNRKNPVKYELIFHAQGNPNPVLTRRLVTIQTDQIFQAEHHVVLDFADISKKLYFPGELECHFIFTNT